MDARRLLAVAVFALAFASAGCRGPTKGELGKATFSYDQGAFGCIAGCPPASEPMAANSRVIIYVTNADDLAPDFTVSSTDESVATFTRSGTAKVNGKNWVGVSAVSLAQGDVKLGLADVASGAEIDRLPLRVHDVKSIELRDRNDKYRDELTIMAGGSASLGLILKDGSGQQLVGHGGIQYVYRGAASEPALLQVLFGDIIASIFTGTAPESMEVATEGPGSGTILATSPAGATLQIPVRVVDASGVTSVKLEADEATGTAGESLYVNASAMAGAEKVYSPECTWALSEVVGPVTIDNAGRDYASLESPQPGSATLTCNIGSNVSTIRAVFK